MIEHDISDHFLILIQLQCKARKKQNFQPLVRKITPQQFDIFVRNLEAHLLSENNDMSLKELIECLVTVSDKIFPKKAMSAT